MTVKRSLRWLPAIVAPVVVLGVAVAVPTLANADAPLPERSASEVLASVAGSADVAYSGTIRVTSDLGLPDLTGVGSPVRSGSGSSDPVASMAELLSGSHDLRVFTDGNDGQRVQVLDSLAERNIVRNAGEVWVYDSAAASATHLTLPRDTRSDGGADATPVTPIDASRDLVEALAPSTEFAVTTTDRVAGRSVYELRLVPRDDNTLVRAVTLAVDAETGLPLRVQVWGEAGVAASAEFSSIDFGVPEARLFDFQPPPGASVEEISPPPNVGAGELPDVPRPGVVGDGWDTIVVFPAGTVDPAELGSADQSGAIGSLLPAVGSGRALQTALISVLITADGHVLAGAVPLSALEAAAG